jgi:hypothetical protein
VPLASLTGPTQLASNAVIVGNSANAGYITKVSFDPTTNRYVIGFSDNAMGGGPTTDLVLDGTNRDQLASTTSQSVHIGDFRGAPFTAKVSTLGSGNPTIALTYTGYASMDYNVPQFLTRYYAIYGIETPALSMPRTGSGTYTGIVTGYGATYGSNGAQSNTYVLSGTGSISRALLWMAMRHRAISEASITLALTPGTASFSAPTATAWLDDSSALPRTKWRRFLA